MWVMIKREIPVDSEFKPERLSLHWAEPWGKLSDKELLNEIRHNEHMMEIVHDYLRGKYVDESSVEDSIMKHIKPIRRILEGIDRFRVNDGGGYCDNKMHKMRIHVNGQDVGVLSHEYSVPELDKLKMFINETHVLVCSDTVYKAMGSMTIRQSKIYEQALTDGCDSFQAEIVVSGGDPFIDVPQPVGWYRIKPEYNVFG